MVSFEIHERLKGHFLNEIRVSFKSSALLEKNLAHFLQLWLCSVDCSIGHSPENIRLGVEVFSVTFFCLPRCLKDVLKT